MLAPTHSVFGVALTLIILALFGVKLSLHWTILFFSCIGAILPDIDCPTSVIGRILYPISSRLERKFGHRTVTHSLIGWLAATTLFAALIAVISVIPLILRQGEFTFGLTNWVWSQLPGRWLAAFSISYFSHLILDMFNKRGSQIFWPDKARDVIPRNPKYRIESGARAEIIVFIIVLILMFAALPISKYGLASTVRWLLATSGSAIEEYQSSNTITYLDFKGYYADTKQPVEGKAEILDIQGKRLIILFNDHVYTVSDELASDIITEKMRVKRTDAPLKVERKEFKNETREYLLSQIPKGARISGVIKLPKGMKVTIPGYAGAFKMFDQKGDDLYLHFASRKEVEKLGLTEQFDLEKKEDLIDLAGLRAKAKKIANRIGELQGEGDLTELGREAILGKNEMEKRDIQLEELENQLDEVNLKIEEVNSKIKSRKLVFSGSVYVRYEILRSPTKPSEARRAKERRSRTKEEGGKVK